MGIRNFPVITIGTDTSLVQAVATAGNVAIPNTEGGSGPKYLHIKAYGPSTATLDDQITVTPDVAANNGAFATGFLLFPSRGDEIILNVHGYTHIGFDEVGAATSSIKLTPLEDY